MIFSAQTYLDSAVRLSEEAERHTGPVREALARFSAARFRMAVQLLSPSNDNGKQDGAKGYVAALPARHDPGGVRGRA